MPRSTQNSQATPLVEVEADANRPSFCDVAGASSLLRTLGNEDTNLRSLQCPL